MVKDLICFKCKHLFSDKSGCAAFPEGIPYEITEAGKGHSKPLEGQKNDIVFEPLKAGI